MTVDAIMSIILEQATPVALAIFAMWMLDRVWNARLAEATRHAQEIDEMRRETLQALQANTEAVTRLCERER